MQYDPIRDAPGLRATLKRLADIERLTSQAVIDLFNKQRTRGDRLSISRATLDRFIQGEDVTRIRELRVIHDLLRAHPAYGRYFDANQGARDYAPNGFAHQFGTFFTTDPNGSESVLHAKMRAPLLGRYVMMRRDHDSITLEQGVRVSSLSLEPADGGVAIQETQSYRTPDYEMPFEQTDRGYLFTHGSLMYFLMKEIDGTAVKFGVIEQTLPELDRGLPVQYFQGHVMVSSRRGVFPRTRFAARRYSPNQHPVMSGIVRLGEIADPRAVEHLQHDYVEDGAAKVA